MAELGVNGITTTTKNVFIPIRNAGIGDAILLQDGMDGTSLSHFKAVAGSTVQATPPSGYAWYGIVYGIERDGLMIRSLAPSAMPWANAAAGGVSVGLDAINHKNVIDTTTSNFGYARNGLNNAAYRAMSVAECAARCTNNNNSNLHPSTGYFGGTNPPMGLANFNADVAGAKTLYGTYSNYIAQTAPILKGSGAGPFQFRCGKENTKELALNNGTDGYSFPAAQYCYNYKVGSEAVNRWWMPDMYELFMMMCDNSFEACSPTAAVIGGNTPRAADRWSCVRYSATNAWACNNYGFSISYYFVSGFTVVPVTLLSL
jgi:hypothetical protein